MQHHRLIRPGQLLALIAIAFLSWSASDGRAAEPVFVPHQLDTIAQPCTDFDLTDLNGDGHPDVVACSYMPSSSTFSGHLLWMKNDGQASPTFTSRWISENDVGSYWSIKSADMDGDGDQDVITNHPYFNGDLVWYENSGGLQPEFSRHVIDTPSTITVQSFQVADFDGDHKPDIALKDNGLIKLYLLDDCHANPVKYTIQVIDASHAYPLVGDFNRDGKPDLIYKPLDALPNEVYWYQNLGGRPVSFKKNKITLATEYSHVFKVMDVDNDNRLDLLLRVIPGGLRLLHNNGDTPLTFTDSVFATIADDSYVRLKDVGDLNLDGKLDLISTRGPEGNNVPINWYESQDVPEKPFAPHLIQQTTWGNVDPIVLCDLNGDKDLDFVAIGKTSGMYSHSGMYWYENSVRSGVATRAWAPYK